MKQHEEICQCGKTTYFEYTKERIVNKRVVYDGFREADTPEIKKVVISCWEHASREQREKWYSKTTQLCDCFVDVNNKVPDGMSSGELEDEHIRRDDLGDMYNIDLNEHYKETKRGCKTCDKLKKIAKGE